ncbi:MAG: hypothetical protein HQL96_05000 [Magnetococcales bacterium]|nr:hypothetical protein [Magnetococcales bacterium]
MNAKIFNVRGQLYAEVEQRSYVRKDGTQASLIVLRSHCSDCGAPFLVTSPWDPEGGILANYLNRRCALHKASGKPVKTHCLWGKPVDLAALTAPLGQGE